MRVGTQTEEGGGKQLGTGVQKKKFNISCFVNSLFVCFFFKYCFYGHNVFLDGDRC